MSVGLTLANRSADTASSMRGLPKGQILADIKVYPNHSLQVLIAIHELAERETVVRGEDNLYPVVLEQTVVGCNGQLRRNGRVCRELASETIPLPGCGRDVSMMRYLHDEWDTCVHPSPRNKTDTLPRSTRDMKVDNTRSPPRKNRRKTRQKTEKISPRDVQRCRLAQYGLQ